MQKPEIETFYPSNQQAWRKWLADNHQTKTGVWLAQYKKKAKKETISWSEAVDEALCFGWIDSIRKTLDEDSYIQFFSPRKAKGTWSKINKDKIELLIERGLMEKAGYDSIALAKQNASWNILDEVDALLIPTDLQEALSTQNGTDYFMGLSKSVKKAMLQWLVLAKRPETRVKRIVEIATLAGQRMKPKQF
jgi:uncharacterized protein YdeI (YjbR/CyaY-like superfamily)